MERDFFGLSSKSDAGTTIKDDAAVRGSGMQWTFSNKVSAIPQYLSFKTTLEDQRKTIMDPLASSGYMTISTKDAYDTDQKPLLSVVQRNLSIGKQAGNNIGMTVYPPLCSGSHLASQQQESRIFSLSNQTNKVSPVLQSNLATTTGHSMVASVIKPQALGSKSTSTPVSALPSASSIVGTTELRNCSKSSGTPTQLTIFYAGSVCVYDDISPEKAQAIMLLAGNGSALNQNNTVSTTKLQPAMSVPSKDNGFIVGMPIPLPSTSLLVSRPGGALVAVGPSTTSTNNLESPNVVSIRSASQKMVNTVGLPQARKASLARFLEKRKERVMSTSPYTLSKKSSPESSNPGSDTISLSMNSSGSCSLPAIN
ncbi:protein TIFY 6B [Arachis duranensis]|uniref:Protein TIFY n=1 Tax=Arachis duranensis TaxID=130453 RepID=A0A6P4DJ41_ARADU|nr:protein TIFY 6B [Arachis duranensis]